MAPGILVYAVFVSVILFGWAQGVFIVFSPYLYDYRNYFQALNQLCFGILGEHSDFNRLREDTWKDGNDMEFLGLASLIVKYSQFFLAVLFVSLVNYLYRKASSFEMGATNQLITPEKERLYKEIKQIKEQVNQIYMIKVKGSEIKEADVQFKNTKIVAWLLNRNQSSLKEEREQFYERVNKELKQMTTIVQDPYTTQASLRSLNNDH